MQEILFWEVTSNEWIDLNLEWFIDYSTFKYNRVYSIFISKQQMGNLLPELIST